MVGGACTHLESLMKAGDGHCPLTVLVPKATTRDRRKRGHAMALLDTSFPAWAVPLGIRLQLKTFCS